MTVMKEYMEVSDKLQTPATLPLGKESPPARNA
jgi:hypothetical protein